MLRWLWQFIKPYQLRLTIALVALVITAGLTLSMGQGIRLMVDQGFAAQSREGLADVVWLFSFIIIAMSTGAYCRFYMVSWIGERVVADLRIKLYKHLLSLTPSFFEDNLAGEIQSRITTDTTLLQSVIGSSFSLALRNSLTFIGGLVLMFISNVKLTLVVLMVVPFIVFPLIYFGRKVRDLSRDSQDRVAEVGALVGESLQHIKVVQAFTREGMVSERFSTAAENAFTVALKRIRQRALLVALVMMLVMGSVTGMLFVGGNDVLAGNISAGDLSAFIFYAIMVAISLAAVTEVYGEVQRAAGAVERIRELLLTKAEICSQLTSAKVASRSSNDKHSERLKPIDVPLLNFKAVVYSYPSRVGQRAVNELSLSIQKGERIALVGPSGAGKSTLFDLLLRFREPQAGNIELNGQALDSYDLKKLRSEYALVPQQPVLFSASVIDNLRYGYPNASEERVIAAAKLAHAHEFIQLLPDGYHSFIGEQGVKLSGGQKQRLAIARAILRDPKILLLDEATSALDAQSEYQVQQALNELMKDRTTLIIAHRLATVAHVDRIAVFDQGKLIAVGDHQALMKTSALYKRLAELQFSVKL